MMNLDCSHSLEDGSFVLVCVMTEYEAVTKLKRVSLLLYFLLDEISCKRGKIVLGNLRLARQDTIHVGRYGPRHHILHVHCDHLDQQRLGIAIVVHSTILGLLPPEFRFPED